MTMTEEDYVTARAAAALLGVSVNTFYVYVGRHRIRSQPIIGSRERLYWRQDLLRLRTRRSAKLGKTGETPPGLAPRDELRRESALTLLTERGPFYRGESAIELARTASLEQVAAILWNCDEATAFGPDTPSAPPSQSAMSHLLEGLAWADRAALLLPMLERADPRSFDLSAAGMARTGGGIVRWLAAILLGAEAPSTDPVHLYVARQLGLDETGADLVRRLLVLSADHGFEPGAYAVRAVAANGVTPWRSVMTGLLVSVGRRSMLSRHEAADRLLAEVLDGPDSTSPVLRFLRDGEAIPGFEASLYGPADPRAEAVLETLAAVGADDPAFRRLTQVIEVARDARGAHPSFMLVSRFVGRRLGLSAAQSLFPLGRAVGWIAHAIEQLERGEAEHREGLYSGPLPKAAAKG